jgi:WD40 repeat protein
VAASDGSDEHPLLDNPDVGYDAIWSPDGKSIVFTSERNGSADLFRVNPDGSDLKALTTDPAYDDQAAFSPDGQKLVFVSTREGGTANLWIDPGCDVAPHAAAHRRGGGRFSTVMVSGQEMDCVFVRTWAMHWRAHGRPTAAKSFSALVVLSR